MKKSQLVSAIKNVLAENKKQKLDENSVRALVREVLAEEGQDITVSLSPAEVSAILDALANSNIENNVSKAGDMQGAGGKILANLAQATAKLKNAYYPNPQADLNEEAYDTVRDIKSAIGNNPTQEDVEEYLGRSLDSDEMDAFGFQIAMGMRNGQPIYASKKPTRYPTYTRRRGGY